MSDFVLGVMTGLGLGGILAMFVNKSWYKKSLKDTEDWANFLKQLNKEWAEDYKELIDRYCKK